MGLIRCIMDGIVCGHIIAIDICQVIGLGICVIKAGIKNFFLCFCPVNGNRTEFFLPFFFSQGFNLVEPLVPDFSSEILPGAPGTDL